MWIVWWVLFLLWMQPDFWTIMVILPVSIIMYFFAWMNFKHLMITVWLGTFLLLSVYTIWDYDKVTWKNNNSLWEKNQKLIEENKMLRNDLKLLGQHCQELNDNKDK